jgi:hypothetical protein
VQPHPRHETGKDTHAYAADQTTLAALVGGLLTIGAHHARPDGGHGSAQASTTRNFLVTLYGWPDNSPPGNAIAYPADEGYPTIHNVASGTGTYADPITYATDQAELPGRHHRLLPLPAPVLHHGGRLHRVRRGLDRSGP